MTKQYFIDLAEYNVWANNIVCGWLEQVSDEQWNRHVVSSFNSIQETALHIISAETAWMDRMNKAEVRWLQKSFTGSKEEHIALWNKTSNGLLDFLAAFEENKITQHLDFKRLNGDAYSMPFYQVLAHMFNHSTFHRGQLVTMLRQVGFTNVSSTDLMGFYRIKNDLIKS
jgi:uncharacterized damage-inducible protein DinB